VKYIKTFESYKSKRDEPVNEELFVVYWTSQKICGVRRLMKLKGWKAYYGTTRHLIEENVSIEIATVTYSKSLWMILKKPEATVDERLF
jgi:hypothetical protein